MKSKKIIIIFMITIIGLILFTVQSNAAVQIVENGARDNNLTVNQAFENCYNMRYQGSTLGNNSLDPHLCNARDWGAMWYMGISSYGSASLHSGTTFINKTYRSLNGNMSGIMYDSSSAPGHILNAAINPISGYSQNTADNSDLYLDANKKYVDKITEKTVENTRGMALQEVNNWDHGQDNYTTDSSASYPVLYREGYYGTYIASGQTDGARSTNFTYRPVIWN